MEKELLRQVGLTDSQARAYLTLIKHESITPPDLAATINENRTTTYSIIDRLVALGLARKFDVGPKLRVQAESPLRIKQLILRHQKLLKDADNQLKTLLPSLTAQYRLSVDSQPDSFNIIGLPDMKLIWDDVLRDDKEVLIINDGQPEVPQFFMVLSTEIARWNRAGIAVKILVNNADKLALKPHKLLEIREIPQPLSPNGQLMIYDVTTVHTILDENLVSTVVINAAITEVQRSIFHALWNSK
jgi:sugar-specific transcriptional regulator TrmB